MGCVNWCRYLELRSERFHFKLSGAFLLKNNSSIQFNSINIGLRDKPRSVAVPRWDIELGEGLGHPELVGGGLDVDVMNLKWRQSN